MTDEQVASATPNDIVAKFEDLGTDNIEDVNGARETIMEVCKTYPDKFFTQKMFRDNLDTLQHDGKSGFSNPYINSILKKLVVDGVLAKTKSGRSSYYRWSGE